MCCFLSPCDPPFKQNITLPLPGFLLQNITCQGGQNRTWRKFEGGGGGGGESIEYRVTTHHLGGSEGNFWLVGPLRSILELQLAKITPQKKPCLLILVSLTGMSSAGDKITVSDPVVDWELLIAAALEVVHHDKVDVPGSSHVGKPFLLVPDTHHEDLTQVTITLNDQVVKRTPIESSFQDSQDAAQCNLSRVAFAPKERDVDIGIHPPGPFLTPSDYAHSIVALRRSYSVNKTCAQLSTSVRTRELLWQILCDLLRENRPSGIVCQNLVTHRVGCTSNGRSHRENLSTIARSVVELFNNYDLTVSSSVGVKF